MKQVPSMDHFHQAISTLIGYPPARSVTKYVSDKARVTATRLHPHDRRNRSNTISVTYGELNYAGREFVKACKRSGEPLPVRKVQIKLWPKKRKAKAA